MILALEKRKQDKGPREYRWRKASKFQPTKVSNSQFSSMKSHRHVLSCIPDPGCVPCSQMPFSSALLQKCFLSFSEVLKDWCVFFKLIPMCTFWAVFLSLVELKDLINYLGINSPKLSTFFAINFENLLLAKALISKLYWFYSPPISAQNYIVLKLCTCIASIIYYGT